MRRARLWTRAVLLLAVVLALGAAAGPAHPQAASLATFDWSMPDRFGDDANGDGLVDYFTPTTVCTGDSVATCDEREPTTVHEMKPEHWRVDLDACASTPSDAGLSWRVVGGGGTVHGGPGCDDFFARFAEEGTYKLELTVGSGPGSSTIVREVVVQDWLILALGDSYGSGEGVPDEPLLESELEAADALVGDLNAALAQLLDFGPCAPGTGFDFDECADILAQAGEEAINVSVSLIKRLNDPVCAPLEEGFDLFACAGLLVDIGLTLAEVSFQAVVDAVSGAFEDYVQKFHDAYAAADAAVELAQGAIDDFSLSAGWQDRRCHRSANAGSAQAARLLELADPRTSVTFVHLACSGAEIARGLVGGYDGVNGTLPFELDGEPEADLLADLDPQAEAAAELIGDRELDAVYLSIGGNDVGFGPIVTACIALAPCNPVDQGLPNVPIADPLVVAGTCLALTPILAPIPGGGFLQLACAPALLALVATVMETGEKIFDDRFKGVPVPADPADYVVHGLYDDLAEELQNDLGVGEEPTDRVDPDRVYLSQYVDATRNDDGSFCPDGLRLVDNLPGGDEGEARWIDDTLEDGLNDAVAAAAGRHTWNHVDGIYDAFLGHGLCAVDNWLVRIHDSFLVEGKISGAVHPNLKGQAAYRNRILASWLADFYPDGSDGAPDIPGTLFSSTNPTAGGSALTRARNWVEANADSVRRPEAPPVADAGGPYVLHEGDEAFAENDSYDGDGGTLSFAWSVSPGGVVRVVGPALPEPGLVALDDGDATLRADVTDDDGTSTDTASVTVRNLAPSLSLGGDATIAEGSTLSRSAPFTDPGANDTHTATIDYGDGAVVGPVAVTGGTVALSHPYVEDGTFTVEVTLADDDGGADTDVFTLTVENAPPVVDAGAGGSILEGETFAGSATYSDPGILDTHSATIDYADGTVVGPSAVGGGTIALSHAYADNGSFPVTVAVTDDDGATGSDSAIVEVANVAPSVGPVTAPIEPVLIGTTIAASSSFSDPGADTYVATWAWGDGSSTAEAVAEGSISALHAYAMPGIYTLTLTVTDDDGGAGTSMYQYVVVYDPEGGFATGGGAIDSPVGAMPSNPSAEGPAHFAFVSKYQRGAQVPTGTTSFRFRAGDLVFASTEYQWLVIAGARAQYKGQGEVNGLPGYGFFLAAIDGDEGGAPGPDRLRVKIWRLDSGQVVYDNQTAAAEDALPTTAISAGSIKVHGPK
ncbi:MAG: PKD domain-containing protein [Gaiellaceae bacterium]